MKPKLTIESIIQKKQVDQLITKFGGQPVWLDSPQWPISQGWDERQMMFICQIALDPYVFGNKVKKMAYIFVTHKENPNDNFFDPDVIYKDAGENAVIIQPGSMPEVETIFQPKGPTLFDNLGNPFEGIPVLHTDADPDFIDSKKFSTISEEEQDNYFYSVDGNKIGGVPNFYQEDEWPNGKWRLLLQLNSSKLPFYLNLGASPTLFSFISNELDRGCLLIQDM